MGADEVSRAIRSDLRRVAVEAPAGCGKTYAAVQGALELAPRLPEGRELLLLAHTNAAVGEFRRRIRKSRAQIRASTLDAFALELVAPYAEPLGLPIPVTPGDGPGQVPFHALAPKAVELLRRSPSLAANLGRHYPVILVDEHQDTKTDQDDFIDRMVNGGDGRLRTFGDPMQAIYDMDSLIDWAAHCRNSDGTEFLGEPHRWNDVPLLGEWTLKAREALQNGGVLRVEDRPACVRFRKIPGLVDVNNPRSERVQPELIQPLRAIVRNRKGTLAVLTRYNAHVRGLKSVLRYELVVQEGADFEAAYAALESAESAAGDPKAMALSLMDLLGKTCTGFTKQFRKQIATSILPQGIDFGRRKRVRPLLESVEPLYNSPDLNTWCAVVLDVLKTPPDWLKIDLPQSLRLLSRVRPTEEESARQSLDAVCRRYREGAPLHRRCASTVHKAKGQAYDHVVIVHCSESVFGNSDADRHLLYTALSRAKKSLSLVLPENGASPLIT